MSRVYDSLKELEDIGENPANAKLTQQSIGEILKGLTKGQREYLEKELLQEILARKSSIHLKVTCPQCKENISLRFRLRLNSKARNANDQEV